MNHYGTVHEASAYHEARGNENWGTDEAKQLAALIRASTALDGMYGDRFDGRKAGGRSQVLAWPRVGAHDHCADESIPDDEIPQGVINAAYELALIELTAPGSTSPNVTPGRITKREKVDVIEREFFGPSDGSPSADSLRPVLATVEDALRCLLSTKGSGCVFLLRY